MVSGNHLSLNIDKTKELVVDYRRQAENTTPINIDKTTCGAGDQLFKFLGVTSTEDLTCRSHRCSAEEGTSASLLPETAEEVWTEPQNPQVLYTCTVESILTGCITPPGMETSPLATAGLCKGSCELPATLLEVSFPPSGYLHRRCTRKARRIIKDSSHPSHRLLSLSLLPSGRRFRSIRSRTSRLRDSFFPQAIRLMNSHK